MCESKEYLNQQKRHDEIRAVYRKLPSSAPSLSDAISISADSLAEELIHFFGYGRSGLHSLPRFSDVGKDASLKELEEVAKAASKLVNKLEDLHRPAVIAMKQAGQTYEATRIAALCIAFHARKAKEHVGDVNAAHRQVDTWKRNLYSTIGQHFDLITGQQPLQGNKAFSNFAQDVLTALGISGIDGESVAKAIHRQKTKDD